MTSIKIHKILLTISHTISIHHNLQHYTRKQTNKHLPAPLIVIRPMEDVSWSTLSVAAPAKEEERLKVLLEADILDSKNEEIYERYTTMASRIFKVLLFLFVLFVFFSSFYLFSPRFRSLSFLWLIKKDNGSNLVLALLRQRPTVGTLSVHMLSWMTLPQFLLSLMLRKILGFSRILSSLVLLILDFMREQA